MIGGCLSEIVQYSPYVPVFDYSHRFIILLPRRTSGRYATRREFKLHICHSIDSRCPIIRHAVNTLVVLSHSQSAVIFLSKEEKGNFSSVFFSQFYNRFFSRVLFRSHKNAVNKILLFFGYSNWNGYYYLLNLLTWFYYFDWCFQFQSQP